MANVKVIRVKGDHAAERKIAEMLSKGYTLQADNARKMVYSVKTGTGIFTRRQVHTLTFVKGAGGAASSLSSVPVPSVPVSETTVQHGPYGWRGQVMEPGDALTPNGYVRKPDGTIVLPKKTMKWAREWQVLGNITGLTYSELVRHVGAADGAPSPGWYKWSRPGYVVSVHFDVEGRALELRESLG